MNWLKEILLIVSTLPTKTKTIFVFVAMFLIAGYFFLDRILDYKAEVIQSRPSETRYFANVDKSDYYIEKSSAKRLTPEK